MMLTKILCVSICIVLYNNAAQSSVVDYQTITWNMQGALSEGRSKWPQVRNLFQGETKVVALQEAGSQEYLPGTPIDNVLVRIANPDGLEILWAAIKWNCGTSSRGEIYYIYFLHTGGNRCNLAIVSKQPADYVIILQRQGARLHERPILGIKLGDDYFFNIHATSGGGSNAAGLVRRVYDYMQTENSRDSWMIMGDFNCGSDSLMGRIRSGYATIAPFVATVSQTLETHKNGGNLDYAVELESLSGSHRATRLDDSWLRYSDHYPVQFNRRPRNVNVGNALLCAFSFGFNC